MVLVLFRALITNNMELQNGLLRRILYIQPPSTGNASKSNLFILRLSYLKRLQLSCFGDILISQTVVYIYNPHTITFDEEMSE